MLHDLLKRLPRLRIRHMVEQRHRPIEFSLTGRSARDGKIDDTERVVPMVVHLSMDDTRSNEKQYDDKHYAQVTAGGLSINHETFYFVSMPSSISAQQTTCD